MSHTAGRLIYGYIIGVKFKNGYSNKVYHYVNAYAVNLGAPVVVDSPYDGLTVTTCVSCEPCFDEESFYEKKLIVFPLHVDWKDIQVKHAQKSLEVKGRIQKKKDIKAKLNAAVKRLQEKDEYNILRGTEYEYLLDELKKVN